MQADTIHFVQRDGGRFYVYTLIDLFSRAAYAEYSPKCNQRASFHFVMRGQDYLGISLAMLQTDNGPEFGKWFHDQLNSKGIALRHSRVHKSNDNAHIERFNRTIKRNAYPQTYAHQLCRKGFIGISHTTTSSGGTQALMEIIRLIYWIGIAANKCVAKVVSLVR